MPSWLASLYLRLIGCPSKTLQHDYCVSEAHWLFNDYNDNGTYWLTIFFLFKPNWTEQKNNFHYPVKTNVLATLLIFEANKIDKIMLSKGKIHNIGWRLKFLDRQLKTASIKVIGSLMIIMITVLIDWLYFFLFKPNWTEQKNNFHYPVKTKVLATLLIFEANKIDKIMLSKGKIHNIGWRLKFLDIQLNTASIKVIGSFSTSKTNLKNVKFS